MDSKARLVMHTARRYHIFPDERWETVQNWGSCREGQVTGQVVEPQVEWEASKKVIDASKILGTTILHTREFRGQTGILLRRPSYNFDWSILMASWSK